MSHYRVCLECAGSPIMPIVLGYLQPVRQHGQPNPTNKHGQHEQANKYQPMHSAAWPCCFFLAWKRCCPRRRQAFMEDVASVSAPDNRRVIGSSCPGIVDGARWFPRWSSIIIRLGIFLVPVWLAVASAGTLNTGHACTLLSRVWRVQKKGFACFGATGVQPGQ